MKEKHILLNVLLGAAGAMVVIAITTTVATAREPCGGLGECKVLIELNTTDGDIGFHFLLDGDDLTRTKVLNPSKERIYRSNAFGELRASAANHRNFRREC